MPRRKAKKARTKTRKLWLEIKFYAPNATSEEVRRRLIRSIQNGTYSYPKSWKVGMYWRNSFRAPMRSGEFKAEMRASRKSSPGFDKAVIAYLRGV